MTIHPIQVEHRFWEMGMVQWLWSALRQLAFAQGQRQCFRLLAVWGARVKASADDFMTLECLCQVRAINVLRMESQNEFWLLMQVEEDYDDEEEGDEEEDDFEDDGDDSGWESDYYD